MKQALLNEKAEMNLTSLAMTIEKKWMKKRESSEKNHSKMLTVTMIYSRLRLNKMLSSK